MKFPIDQEPETLIEYRDSFYEQFETIEHLAIGLENCPSDLSAVEELTNIFSQLWFSSTKLSLTPIVENLNEVNTILNFIIAKKNYPTHFSEFLLILIDRLLMVVNDALHTHSIDMLKVQNIHIALQTIMLCKSSDEINQKVATAVAQITKSAGAEEHSLADDFDVLLFDDDDITLFGDDSETARPNATTTEPPSDPILAAREYAQLREHDVLHYLGSLADQHTDHGTTHTKFLHEIAIAMNFMEGEPIANDDLWAAICLHDIGLSHLGNILSEARKLTKDELEQVQQHPTIGCQLSEKMRYSEDCQRSILEHHERVDGRGYPYGLTGEHISTGGKILAIVDSFHAMISVRPHKRHTKNILRAVSEINACSGTHYDPHWVSIFNNCIRLYWLPKYFPAKSAADDEENNATLSTQPDETDALNATAS